MKCHICGAWTIVKETRESPIVGIRRRRECGNGHLFTTIEVLPAVVSKRDLRGNMRAAKASAARWQRDDSIRRDPRSATQLAKVWGISEARVRQIRKAG